MMQAELPSNDDDGENCYKWYYSTTCINASFTTHTTTTPTTVAKISCKQWYPVLEHASTTTTLTA